MENNEAINTCMEAVPVRRSLPDRIVRWFFDTDYHPWPFPEDEVGKVSGHGVSSETVIAFDWKDRLRILFGGLTTVRVCSTVENDPGRAIQSNSVAWVAPPVPKAKIPDLYR